MSIRTRLLSGTSALKAIISGEDPKGSQGDQTGGGSGGGDEDEDGEGEQQAVVSLADAHQAAETARTEGAAAGKTEGLKEGTEAGAKAERERCAAVFGSKEGSADPAMAAWLLAQNPEASAEDITAKLGTMPNRPTGPDAEAAALRDRLGNAGRIERSARGTEPKGDEGDKDAQTAGLDRYRVAHGLAGSAAVTQPAGTVHVPNRGS